MAPFDFLADSSQSEKKNKQILRHPAGLLVYESDGHVTVCLARLHGRLEGGGTAADGRSFFHASGAWVFRRY